MITKLTSLVKMAEAWNTSHTLVQPDGGKFLLMTALAEKLADKRLIYFGESHEQPEVVDLELKVLKILVEVAKSNGKGSVVNVFMEHFNFEQQDYLNQYMQGSINEEQLFKLYKESGSEGHDLEAYTNFITFARNNCTNVKLYAGFIPRKFAQRLVKEGEEPVLQELKTLGYLNTLSLPPGSENHYNFFESLISGRNLETDFQSVGERFKRIFPAQVLKDTAMATAIANSINNSTDTSDKFLVLAGAGHIDYRFGVPERVDSLNLVPKEETLILTVRDKDALTFTENSDLLKIEAFDSKFPGDVVLLYEQQSEDENLKEEIRAAYEKVASTAHKSGNLKLAAAVMTRLGYTKEQIDTAGIDAYNYQGVGCPHLFADIKEGAKVLDVGSGLGVDSFIAAGACGSTGSVIGIDISKGEVLHANTRAESRNSENTIFIQADMEKMPFPDNSFDNVISNGAFCLAPNKERAFREIHRVLKPGGSFSVCCTTLLTRLEDQVNWPVCMRVFMPLKDAESMLENIGFQAIKVDQSDSTMTLDIQVPEEELEQGEMKMQSSENSTQSEKKRQGVHVGSPEFSHLKDYDMDKLCARVTLIGTKPC